MRYVGVWIADEAHCAEILGPDFADRNCYAGTYHQCRSISTKNGEIGLQ